VAERTETFLEFYPRMEELCPFETAAAAGDMPVRFQELVSPSRHA
jgi:hypothetical protein